MLEANGGPGLSAGGRLRGSLGGCEGHNLFARPWHGSACNVEPCEELRAPQGWMGFAASFPEPLLAAGCCLHARLGGLEDGQRAPGLTSHLLLICPCLLLVPALRHLSPVRPQGNLYSSRELPSTSAIAVAPFFLLLPLSAWDEDQFLPSAVTAAFHSTLWERVACGGGDVAHLGEPGYLSLKCSSWIACHLFLCPGMHMTHGAGAPPDTHPLVFGCIPGRSFPARTEGADPCCCHGAHTTTHLGSLLVLSMVERWLDVISSMRSAVLRSLHSWRTSAVLPARLRSSALSFLISTPCSRLVARFSCLPACPGGSGLPPQPSLQVCKAAGLCLSKRRRWRADPSAWDQQPTALAAATAVEAGWGGIKRQRWPKPGRAGRLPRALGFLFTGRRVAGVCGDGSV